MPTVEPPLQVSDHAVVRWIERVHGIDMDAIRSRIVAEMGKAVAMGKRVGQDTFTVRAGSHKFVVKRGVIVTVLPASMDAKL